VPDFCYLGCAQISVAQINKHSGLSNFIANFKIYFVHTGYRSDTCHWFIYLGMDCDMPTFLVFYEIAIS
jgi:hypothetical protein